jgi:hypothetical protein
LAPGTEPDVGGAPAETVTAQVRRQLSAIQGPAIGPPAIYKLLMANMKFSYLIDN